MAATNVLQICLSPSWGGLEMVAFETALRLINAGTPCVTVAPKGSPLAKRLQQNQAAVIEVEKGAGGAFGTVKTLRNLIRTQNIDCILVQHLRDLPHLRLALLGLPLPKVIGFSHTFVAVSKKDFYHAWLYKILYRLVALTPSHAENLLQHVAVEKRQMAIIPNSVDTHKFSPSRKSETIRKAFDPSGTSCLIGLVGRLDKAKGQGLLLDAGKILREKGFKDFKLILVGEETLNEPGILQSLKSFTKNNHLDDQVIFTGYRDDIPDIMASLDVIVMASDAETFGRVIIEAMASGTVVVATRAGGVIDIIADGNDGCLFTPRNPQELAERLEFLIQNPASRTKLANAALEKIHRTYSNSLVQQEILALVNSRD